MNVADSISLILSNKNSQETWQLGPDESVFSAIKLMSEKNVGALLVTKDNKLVGIVSERDYTRKVILKGLSSKETPVRDIMTSPVSYIKPATTVSSAMQLMTEKHIRHLPVLDDGEIVGVVSIGDLVRRTMHAQGALIDQMENYMSNTYLG